ncbi:MAG: ATP-binding protein [Clostridium sp.]|nr:ATP-binding protein [Acetatifactor muris]MCM1527167.1 ATP-binding protein [Bacteroides sp.]MCM1562508.1 ATP-binding protein [Clostridium sp.]
MEGYGSIEEQIQDYIELFGTLNQPDEGDPREEFESIRARIGERERAGDVPSYAECLRDRCKLTDTEYYLVMFAFCRELEGSICSDFWQRCREGRPDLHYALQCLSRVLPVDFAQIARLREENGAVDDLLALPAERSDEDGFLARPLTLSPAAFHFLLTGRPREENWFRIFRPEDPGAALGEEMLPLHGREIQILRHEIGTGRPFRILLHGEQGCGRHTLLRRACLLQSVNLLFIRAEGVLGDDRETRNRNRHTLRLICRLFSPVVVLEPGEGFGDEVSDGEERTAQIGFLLEESLAGAPVVFMTKTQTEARSVERLAQMRLEPARRLTPEEQEMALDAWLSAEERQPWQIRLLNRYRLNIREWKVRQRAIRDRAEAEHIPLTDPAAWEAGLRGRKVSSALGRVVEEPDSGEELILPADCESRLETVAQLAERWSGRQGLHILFHGSSGTGKTMAASILAKRLRMPLFKVDLSRVFDKYIGETEKHMDEIFGIAQSNRYLLFFDEADALFSKRTGVQDARDKYANVSTSYLLQRIEEYDGMLILATNLLSHFDEAFVRRVRFVIKFRNPDEERRERLWTKALAAEGPLSKEVSLSSLARAADLSPARIRAAARVAGMLADCDPGGVITGEHLSRALELEAGKDETAVRNFR